MSQEITSSVPVQREMTIGSWLFNPFIRIAGAPALALGLACIVISGLAGGAAGVRFDGLLDLHAGNGAPLWFPVVEGLVNWLVITTLLSLAALLFARNTVRLVDIAGTQALARWPLLLAAAVCLLPPVRRAFDGIVARASTSPVQALPGWEFIAGTLVIVAACVWMIALMWKAFSISSNMQGKRSVAIFIAAVVIGELMTKYLVIRIGPIG